MTPTPQATTRQPVHRSIPLLGSMADIGAVLGVQPQTVRVWNRNTRAWRRANPDREAHPVPPLHATYLPEPWPSAGAGYPKWHMPEIREWALQVGRLSPDGQPRIPPPPGRAVGSKNRPKDSAPL